MLTYLVLWLALAAGGPVVRDAAAPASETSEANPWSVLLEDGAADSAGPREEPKMNVAAIILALAAAGVAAAALYWSYKMNQQMARLRAGLLTQDEKQAVERATDRHNGLEARLSGLESRVAQLQGRFEQFEQRVAQFENRSGQFESRFGQVESDVAQLQSRLAKAEETCRTVGPLAEDLARFAKFKGQVEQIHSRVLQAFDGVMAQSNRGEQVRPRSSNDPLEKTA